MVKIKPNDTFIVMPKGDRPYICKALNNCVIIISGEVLPSFKEYYISIEYANCAAFQINNIRIINTRNTKLGKILYR